MNNKKDKNGNNDDILNEKGISIIRLIKKYNICNFLFGWLISMSLWYFVHQDEYLEIHFLEFLFSQ